MTPTEQDRELREKLNSLFESVFSQGMRAGKDVATETYEDFDAWRKADELDETMQLITADRKRVALEARIDELEHTFVSYDNALASELVENPEWEYGQAVERIAELKQELEKL